MREPEAVQARRGLGAELAAYRRAAGYTQAEFAKLTQSSRSTVANAEIGRQHVPRTFWERADTVLRTGGVLASAWDDMEASARGELRAAARKVSATRRARSTQRLPDAAPLAHHDLAGRQELATAAGLEAPASNHFGNLERLRSMRQHLKAIDDAHGGQAAFPMTEWYLRHEVLPLLNGEHNAKTSPSLVEIAAQFQLDAGWMAYDADLQERAAERLASALRLARGAGDRLLGARVLAAMSHQAIYLDHRRQAIDFAQAARAATRQIATPRTVAMLAAMEACAHAAASDARQCQQALDDAAEALTQISNGQPEPDWLDFDEGGYWGHAARAYRDLGQADKAEQCAAKSVGLCQPEHARTRAQRTTIQATACLELGEADAAAAAAELVVHEAWNLHSGRVFSEVAQLADMISPFATPGAKEFEDQARELLTARAPMLEASRRASR